jgi:SAM-dependent methyltransferase
MDKSDAKAFWNNRSKSFPGHRDDSPYQEKMLEIAVEHGVDFANSHILDLGCGSGAYSIRLAKMAKKVTALDISDGMLSAVKKAAKENNINNINYVEADWIEYIPREYYDIIFASLTPAIKSGTCVEKLGKFCKNWVINIGFAAPMEARMLEELFDHFSLARKGGFLEPIMKNYLTEMGVPFDLYPVSGEWTHTFTRDGIIANCKDLLTSHGYTADDKKISDFVERYNESGSGKYITKTVYNVEMLIWNCLENPL